MFLERDEESSSMKLGYEFTEQEFGLFQKLIHDRTGIHIEVGKRNLLYGRLARRLRALDLNSFSEYYELIREGHGEEIQEFTNVVTTNLTSFFRQPLQFDYLYKLFTDMSATKENKKLRIWSVGCSTGEEPYSIAAVAHEVFGQLETWDIKILGVDIDSNVLDMARQGIYSEERINDIPQQYRKKSFLKGSGNHSGLVKVNPELTQMVTFRPLNLMDTWPVRGPFDIIFCRNVIIYFDKNTQAELFPRFADLQNTDDHIFIGFSETLFSSCKEYALIQNSVYKRV